MSKPSKPTPDFPLFAHQNGQWAKKINGKVRYFGLWDDPEGALSQHLALTSQSPQKPRKSTPNTQSLTNPTAAVKDDGRPKKPYPDFPLYAHKTRRWAKRIRGKNHFFGPWRDPYGALRKYLTEKDDLEAGRRPVRKTNVGGELAVQQMIFLFLASKKLKVEAGEMTAANWRKYELYGDLMIQVFGANTPVSSLGPLDFQKYRQKLQKTHKTPESIKTALSKTKAIFNWAGPGPKSQGYLDKLPRFGDAFVPPSRSTLDRARRERGKRVFAAGQIRFLLNAARPNLKAMIFLGINCGYGNSDCAALTTSDVDLLKGWAMFPRTKNGNPRRCPIWAETIEAVKEVLKTRKEPKDSRYSDRVFITKYRQPFFAYTIGHEFEKVAEEVGMKREDADFYDLRRTCASIGVQMKDDDAVRTIMGHKRPSQDMLGIYNRMEVDDERLRAITDHIHSWLFPDEAAKLKESGEQVAAFCESVE